MNNLIQSKKQTEKLKLLAEKQLKTDEKFMREAIKQAKLALKNGDVRSEEHSLNSSHKH